VEARSSNGLLRLPRTERVTAAIAEEVSLPRKESLMIEVEGANCMRSCIALPQVASPMVTCFRGNNLARIIFFQRIL